MSEYRVVHLPDGMTAENREPLGSKKKLWFRDQSSSRPRLLFKYNRSGTGEDWSEKISAELAALLGLPHSLVELATFEGERGAALVDFTENDRFALVHGNEVLEFVDPAYPKEHRFGAVSHTPGAVLSALAGLGVGLPETNRAFPAAIADAPDLFVGYLMLDVWIGNTDRHHENWGVLRPREPPHQSLILAPSFDHASSLGRELNDASRRAPGNPQHGTPVERYAKRAWSGFYASDGSERRLTTLEAFTQAAHVRPLAAQAWLGRLQGLAQATVEDAVESVPDANMGPTAKAFACALLGCNAKLLSGR
ncbi:MAG: HipA-like protein [Polyangiaceae bacterium]